MSIFPAFFWGMLLWGLFTLIMPTSIYYALLVLLGTLTMISGCLLLALFIFEWLGEHFRD